MEVPMKREQETLEVVAISIKNFGGKLNPLRTNPAIYTNLEVYEEICCFTEPSQIE